MNGIHDVGGLTCFGPVVREADEPVFHDDWERRVFAVSMLSGSALGPVDAFRHAIERMDPQRYLATTYFEHWLAGIERLVEERHLADAAPAARTLQAEQLDAIVARGVTAERDSDDSRPRYAVGDRVVAKNLNPRGHTRLPRYVRGRRGEIAAIRGNHVFPDTAAHLAGENPQPLYSVRFAAGELWGPDAPAGDSLYLDLWESYLEEAAS